MSTEITDFKAECYDKKVILTWYTVTEHNSQYFIIENSDNAINCTPLKKINGAGNSMKLIKYKYIVEKPFSADNYYRLKQLDFDGQFKYTRTISATCHSTTFSIPNNIILSKNAKLHINIYSELKTTLHIQLTDALGRQRANTTFNAIEGDNQFEIQSNLTGTLIYFLTVSNKYDKKTIKVLIK